MSQIENELKLINKQLEALLGNERNMIANLSNASALLFNNMRDLNWAGFYLLEGQELILGPFQGLPACVRIKTGKGVCGSAVRDKKTYLVSDVHKFPGHIACDQASQSEIVVPIIINGEIIGVLDVDSPIKNRFTENDQQYLEDFVEILITHTDFV
ncbi:MAG: GAF domain-containing protein [Halanaerobiales bacterium]